MVDRNHTIATTPQQQERQQQQHPTATPPNTHLMFLHGFEYVIPEWVDRQPCPFSLKSLKCALCLSFPLFSGTFRLIFLLIFHVLCGGGYECWVCVEMLVGTCGGGGYVVSTHHHYYTPPPQLQPPPLSYHHYNTPPPHYNHPPSHTRVPSIISCLTKSIASSRT